jgi:hypothetical protein
MGVVIRRLRCGDRVFMQPADHRPIAIDPNALDGQQVGVVEGSYSNLPRWRNSSINASR